MPRLKTAPPKYGRHKASGHATILIDGKRHYLGQHGSPASWQKYHQLIKQWRIDRDAQPAVKRDDPKPDCPKPKPATEKQLRERLKAGGIVKLVELAAVYHERNKTYYRKNGRLTREAETIREAFIALLQLFPNANVHDIGPLALSEFQQFAIDEKDWSRVYINKQVDRLKRGFRWGVEKQIVAPSVHQALQCLSGLKRGRSNARETKRVKPVDDKTVELTLPHLSSVVADMVRLQRLTGARPGEICAIRPCDVDRTHEIWKYSPAEHKTEGYDKERTIFIGPQGQAVLRKYLLRPTDSYCFDPRTNVEEMRAVRRSKRSTPLSCGNRAGTNRTSQPRRTAGDHYDNHAYRRAIHRACRLAFPAPDGITGAEKKAWYKRHRWSPNQLRHATGTEVRKKFGLDAAQVVLGHAKANTTEIYAEKDFALAAHVAREVG